MTDLDLTHLDSKELNRFIEEVADFSKALRAIRADQPKSGKYPAVPALSSLVEGRTTPETLNQNPVLAVGAMAGDDLVHGKALVEGLTKSAQALDDVLVAQQTLFKDIESNLQTTVDTLLRNQSDSLAAVDGEKLLDVFADVDNDLGHGSSSRS
ncbi:type VII secretion system-associated protein [Streptomyces sp. IBSBF 2953]|uniref:type VII secretion system-associated protein n=1 Tax=Streptomyces TaxID=1883 RepID=UPI002119F019|nr:type VII secretion system-associated protein [Streptomyces scabiei]MCQ9183299.1 type VII secretion system-associated protein [Streptomyces hayashii]MDX3117801.1 type VII secretion system-associated protein [Streptomyces scabiei]